uniref:Uncharacterized protein n=1 Tax=Lotus japonicus TaxID=34305 RepID=I3S4R9_LOTJA|nr:unknown [Lotus japonicus]
MLRWRRGSNRRSKDGRSCIVFLLVVYA